MAEISPELLTSLLKQVSRSFYLTLRILPGAIRPQIGLAYLLARATDSIADTEVVPVASRLEALQALRARILGKSESGLNLSDIARRSAGEHGASERQSVAEHEHAPRSTLHAPPPSPEQMLLERIDEVLRLLSQFSKADQHHIREVLHTITTGQMLDLERFACGTIDHIAALQTDQDLDDYTYRVAGCVGEFWTRMCRAHVFPKAVLDDTQLLADGVRFGKGLQLVNILRDVPADLRAGRCYLPAEPLRRLGLSPADLLKPANEPAFQPLYQQYLAQAHGHLAAGWAYTNALPRRCVRVRLACAWPILIGVQTLQKLHLGNVLEPTQRIKISRSEVRRLIVRSVLSYPWPKAWERLFAQDVLGYTRPSAWK